MRERCRLNHAIVGKQSSAERCGSKPFTYATRLSWRQSAIYSTLTNTALDLLGVGSTGIVYELKILQLTQSFKLEK